MLTLTTDFGSSEYVAQMKGVILGIHPKARIVDVAHNILPQNVLQGAYVLATTVPYFPVGTVHVAVVDPGVGGPRRAIAIRAKNGWLVGPDNGLLWPAAHVLGPQEVRELTEPAFFRTRVSDTFHGRDVFAPVAAHLAADGANAFGKLGPVIDDAIELRLDEGSSAGAGRWQGVVLHVDRFGNIITNLPEAAVAGIPAGKRLRIRFDDGQPHSARRVSTYGEAGPDEFVALVSSSRFLEIAMNEDDAARRAAVRPGAAVEIKIQDA